MSDYFNKRLSLDYAQILNEGAALRMPLTDADLYADDDSQEEEPLAPRYQPDLSFKKTNHSSVGQVGSQNARVASIDRHLEQTLTSIKSMSLMFESGALQQPGAARPPSFANIDAATQSSSRSLVVPAAPPPRSVSSAHRAQAQPGPEHDSPALPRTSSAQSSSSPSDAGKSYVRDLENRVEQLEAMLASMQERLEAVLGKQVASKIPSKHDPAPPAAVQQEANQAHVRGRDEGHEALSITRGAAASAAVVTTDSGPNTDRSGPHTDRSSISNRSGRRLSIQGVAKGMIFARRLHLPEITHLPAFDKTACSKGILLQNANMQATLMQFGNTPHPYCLCPAVGRGASMMSITLYFGEPALPTIRDSASLADLQAVLKSGSTDDIVDAVLSSPPEDLSQALKATDHPTLAALSKQFGVAIRMDGQFEAKCRALRQRCVDLANNAAIGGVCFFGVCGANLPSHGLRGNEMAWCSSMNDRKDPGPPKTKPFIRRDEKMASLEFYMNLLLADMRAICDFVPGLVAFMTNFFPVRQAGREDSASIQETLNPWAQMGSKQFQDLLAALPKTFPTWPEELKNIFVFRGISDDIDAFDRSLGKVIEKQNDLAAWLKKLPLNQRRDALLSWIAKNHPDRSEIPVMSEARVLVDDLQLTKTPKCLQHPDSNPYGNHPLMTEDGRLVLASEESRPSSAFNSRNSSTEHLSPRLATADVKVFQSAAAVVQFKMRAAEDILDLVGGSFSDEKLKKHIPTHDSIGTSRPSQQYTDSSFITGRKLNMHPVFNSTDVVVEFDKDNKGLVEGLRSYVEGILNQMKSIHLDLQDLSEQPGQLFLKDDIFRMENFALEMNTNYLPRSHPLQLNPAQQAVTVSVSLTEDIRDIKDKVIFSANQFYEVRLVDEESFKLFAPSGGLSAKLRDIPMDRAVKLKLSIASVKRSTQLPRAAAKTGKTQEVPSVVIPWMPGKMDQFSERRQLGCGTFGPGSILTLKLDAPRRRLWLSNGVSGSGNVQGIPSEGDSFSRMFNLDFPVIRPFVAFSSKYQNVMLMPELPAVVVDIYKKCLSLEVRLADLTGEFSELGSSNSLIIFGFSSVFLESEGEPDLEMVQQKLKKRFQPIGIAKKYDYLNFKIFNMYVKSSRKVEQVCKVEFSSQEALDQAITFQTEEKTRFKVQKLKHISMDEIHRDHGNAPVDYYIAEEKEVSNAIIFRSIGAVSDAQELFEVCNSLLEKQFPGHVIQHIRDAPSASQPHQQSFKVSFEDSEAAGDELKRFIEESAAGEDASDFCKAFTAESYVPNEEEVSKTASESWIQFKDKSKSFVAAHNSLQEHYSDCQSASGYDTAFAPILQQANKILGLSKEVVKGLCTQMQNLF